MSEGGGRGPRRGCGPPGYGDGVWSAAFHPSGDMPAACGVEPEIRLLTRTG